MKKEGKNNKHHLSKVPLTVGQRAADKISLFAGSWKFIIGLILILFMWIIINACAVIYRWDPYPFILLNLGLSCLATFQAPIILMAQNRAAERDRINYKYDYQVNRKAEREIQQILKSLSNIKKKLK